MRFYSSVFEYLENVGIGIFDRGFSTVRYLFGKYGIYVKIKENKEVVVAAERWYDELTCLISAYFPSDVLKINIRVASPKTCCLFV